MDQSYIFGQIGHIPTRQFSKLNKMFFKKLCLFFILMFIGSYSFANQYQIIDSLKIELKKAKHDTIRTNLMIEISSSYGYINNDSVLFYSQKAYEFSKKHQSNQISADLMKYYDLIIGMSLNNIGSVYNDWGHIDTALQLYQDAFVLFEKYDNNNGMASANGNIGYIYMQNKVDFKKAIYYFQESLKNLESLDEPNSIANTYTNLGSTYDKMGMYQKSYDYYLKALKLFESSDNKWGTMLICNNIGSVCQDLRDDSLALKYFKRGISISKELSDSTAMGYLYNNIGALYMDHKKYDEAIENYTQALVIRRAINSPKGLANSLGNIGLIRIHTKNYSAAQLDLEEALKISREIQDTYEETAILSNLSLLYFDQEDYNSSLYYGLLSYNQAKRNSFEQFIRTVSHQLYKVYKHQNQADSALKYFEIHTSLKDSLMSADNIRESTRMQMQYDLEKEDLMKAQKEKERLNLEKKNKERRNSIQYMLILIGILTLAAFLLFIGRFNVNTRQAQGLIFLTFLIIFEFLLVILDPYVDMLSGGAPAIKLSINAMVAALIFPLHHYAEGKIKNRVLQKVKK